MQPARERRPNERFNDYTLVAKLGAGGMGETWLARKPGLDKKVVIKMMRPELAEVPQAHQYFTAEGALGAKLHHGNIVNLIDRNTFEGVSYLVLEHVEGKDLEFLLTRFNRFSPEWAVYVASEVLQGLDYVHNATIGGQHGEIVHRDVTPDNVFLSAAGEVKLGDWGIAQVKSALRERTKIPGAIKGKYKYLSPEMARGEPVDHRADLFQVGLLLYEMLTGTAAFSGTRAGTEAIARCEYQRIPTVVSDVPPPLVAAVEKLMQSRPEDRPFTAALADDLIKEACPTFWKARKPIAEAVLRFTDVSTSSTFAVPDALRAMYEGTKPAPAPEPPRLATPPVMMTAGASDRTVIPFEAKSSALPEHVDDSVSPTKHVIGEDVSSAVTPILPESPRRARPPKPTKYVPPLPIEGVRERSPEQPGQKLWIGTIAVSLAAMVVGAYILIRGQGPGQQQVAAVAQAPAPAPPVEQPLAPAPAVPAPIPVVAPATPPAAAPAPAAPAQVAAPVAAEPKKPHHTAVPKPQTGEIVVYKEATPIKVKIDGASFVAPVHYSAEPGLHEVVIIRGEPATEANTARSTVNVSVGGRYEMNSRP